MINHSGLLIILLIYLIVVPMLFSFALRIFLSFAEILGVPRALGRFAAKLVDSFWARVRTASNE